MEDNFEKNELRKRIKVHKIMNRNLWTFVTDHINEKTFKRSKNSLLQLLIIPPLFNIFISSRLARSNRVLKPYLSIGCFLTFFIRSNQQINNDIIENAFIYEELSNIIKDTTKIDIYNFN